MNKHGYSVTFVWVLLASLLSPILVALSKTVSSGSEFGQLTNWRSRTFLSRLSRAATNRYKSYKCLRSNVQAVSRERTRC